MSKNLKWILGIGLGLGALFGLWTAVAGAFSDGEDEVVCLALDCPDVDGASGGASGDTSLPTTAPPTTAPPTTAPPTTTTTSSTTTTTTTSTTTTTTTAPTGSSGEPDDTLAATGTTDSGIVVGTLLLAIGLLFVAAERLVVLRPIRLRRRSP